MATQNPTTQTPPVIDMGISSFNTTGKATTTTPPIQPIEEKIKSGTATAQDFAAYNIQKGSKTAGSELLQQIKPTTTPTPKTIDMGISSFNVSQPTPPINSNPTTQIATLNPNNQGKTGFNYDAMVSGFGGNYMDGQGNLTGNKDDVYNKGLDYLKSKGASDTEINEWKNKVDSHFAGGKTDIELQKTIPTTTQRQGEELKPVTTTPAPKRELMPGETITPTKIDATSTDEQIKARQEQLYNNLNSLYSANDQQLKSIIDSGDYEKYISRFNTTNPDEKKIVDAFYQANQPKTIDAFFNILKSGQKIQLNSVLNNPQYKTAKDVFDDYSNMKNYNSEQFATVLKNGELIKNQTLYNELIKDPIIAANIAKAEKLNLINKTTTNTEAVTQNQTDAILSKNQTLKQALENNEIDDNEMKALLSSPEIDSLNKEVVDLKTKYDEVKAEYDDIENSIRNQYKGTGALEGYIQAKIGKAQKDIFKRLEVAQNTYNNKLGYLTDLKKEKADLLNVNLDLYKTQEERQYKADLLAEERKYQEGLANREFDLKYGDINSTDPRIQSVAIKNAVADLYTKYPIKGMESAAVKEQKVRDYMSGKTTGTAMSGQEAIAQVESEIRNSPGYNNLMEAQANELAAKPQTATVDGNLYQYDTKSGKWNLAIKGTDSSKTSWGVIGTDSKGENVYGFINTENQTINIPTVPPAGTKDTKAYTAANNAKIGTTYNDGQCGTYANDLSGIGSDSAIGSNGTLSSRKSVYTDTSPKVGGLVLLYDNKKDAGYDDNYGHVAVVSNVTDKGIEVKEQNYRGDKKVGTRFISFDAMKNTGTTAQYYNNTPLANSQSTTTQPSGTTKVVEDWGQRILNGNGKITDIPAGDKGLRSQVTSYIAEKEKQTQNTNISTLFDTIKTINELKNNKEGLKASVGLPSLKVWQSSFVPGSEGANFMSKLEQLTAQNFMTGIKGMKGLGSLSDAEGSKVAASVSSLSKTGQSEENFIKELDRLKEVLEGRIKSTEIATGLKYDSMGFPINTTQQNNNTQQNNFNPWANIGNTNNKIEDELFNSLYDK